MLMDQFLEVGQEWETNRAPYFETVHVLAIFTDMMGKNKVAVQVQSRKKLHVRPHYYQAKLVTPQWFWGMTIKIKKEQPQ